MFLVMKIRQLLAKSNVPHLHRNVTEAIILQMIAKKNENWPLYAIKFSTHCNKFG